MEVMPAHVECAKRTFNVLARTPYSPSPFLINETFH